MNYLSYVSLCEENSYQFFTGSIETVRNFSDRRLFLKNHYLNEILQTVEDSINFGLLLYVKIGRYEHFEVRPKSEANNSSVIGPSIEIFMVFLSPVFFLARAIIDSLLVFAEIFISPVKGLLLWLQ